VQVQDIEKILGLQGIRIINITHEKKESELKTTTVTIKIEPLDKMQQCPCCKSTDITRNGIPGYKEIKHLDIAMSRCILLAARQRYKCKACGAAPTCEYEFVKGKERYTKAFKDYIYRISIGSTIQHGAEIAETPYSTAERFFKETVLRVAPKTIAAAQTQARQSEKLILGIDDFAIRKGHNYNTGIHDLRGENLIGIVEGRTLDDLRAYMKKTPSLSLLEPYAIIMDLAKSYHSFVAEFFPGAIRVADRFHVNGYILEALNEVRRRVSIGLPPLMKPVLKRNKHLLNKRGDSLDLGQRQQLKRLLACSTELKAIYDFKEQLIDWYDLSFDYESAKNGFRSWLKKGHELKIPEVTTSLKTFVNWQDEIINYHRCRFTNGIVEGRNAKIKSLQRRRFFLHNRIFYEDLIFIECNREIAHIEFNRPSA